MKLNIVVFFYAFVNAFMNMLIGWPRSKIRVSFYFYFLPPFLRPLGLILHM